MKRAIIVLSLGLLAAASGPTGALVQGSPPREAEAIITDLAENSMSAEEIRTAEQLRTLRTRSLSGFAGQPELEQIEETLRRTEDNFAEVRTAIEANQVFESALRVHGIPIASVTAATMGENGVVTIYTDLPIE